MIACLDVGYTDTAARAACVVIKNWRASRPAAEHVAKIHEVKDYQPGEFYRRELPCIQAVLDKLKHPPTCIVVDGYVWLDEKSSPRIGGPSVRNAKSRGAGHRSRQESVQRHGSRNGTSARQERSAALHHGRRSPDRPSGGQHRRDAWAASTANNPETCRSIEPSGSARRLTTLTKKR